jgi:hypothetical protein
MTFTKPSSALLHLIPGKRNRSSLKTFQSALVIRYPKTYTSASSLTIIYHAFFHSAMSYGIIFWGNSSHSSTISSMLKKAIRIMEGCGNRVHVETYLRN